MLKQHHTTGEVAFETRLDHRGGLLDAQCASLEGCAVPNRPEATAAPTPAATATPAPTPTTAATPGASDEGGAEGAAGAGEGAATHVDLIFVLDASTSIHYKQFGGACLGAVANWRFRSPCFRSHPLALTVAYGAARVHSKARANPNRLGRHSPPPF